MGENVASLEMWPCLKQAIEDRAEERGCSVNAFVTEILDRRVIAFCTCGRQLEIAYGRRDGFIAFKPCNYCLGVASGETFPDED